MKRKVLSVALASLLLCGAAAGADVYRWVDADGEIHFGDRPKSGGEPVEIRTPEAAEPGAEAATEAPTDTREENCDRASKRLAEYEQADQLVGEDEYGRKREISTDEHVEMILSARKDVEEFCGEATASTPTEPAPVKPVPEAEAAQEPATDEAAAAAASEGTGLSSY